GNFIVSVEVPVRIGGEIRYVIAAGLSPAYFSEVLKRNVPPEWIGSIVDQRGILISRAPEMGVVGQPVVPILLEQVGRRSGRWIEIQSREGAKAYNSFLRSPALGWTVFLSVRHELLASGIRQSVIILTAMVVLALIISLFLARLLSLW